jgi:hypothetical protein
MVAAQASLVAPLRIPVRNLYLTFALTFAALAAVGKVWGTAGYEMLIVAMGWPHILLGFVFFWGKVLRREPGTRARCALLAEATLVWWGAHYAVGVAALIYVYFLYHAFRDEIFVYLTTRVRHRGPTANVYARVGVVPLLLLLLVISQPADYRQDLRRVELTTTQANAGGWTLFSFKPVPGARGHDFYFYLQAPYTQGANGLIAKGLRGDGNSLVRVNHEPWREAGRMIFAPQYNGAPAPPLPSATSVVPVGLLGGHNVGQTFRAEQDNLSGLWLATERAANVPEVPLVLHLASPPLLPLEPFWASLRYALIVLAGAFLLWQVLRNWRAGREMWLYLGLFGATLIAFQNWLKIVVNEGWAVPMIFQFVVVFHYFSWYVFSFDKMRALAGLPLPPVRTRFDHFLAYLRVPGQFAVAVAVMSLVSAGGVAWYYSGSGPGLLRYGFDYSYFLYFLVFHVTFSFSPTLRHPKLPQVVETVAKSAT